MPVGSLRCIAAALLVCALPASGAVRTQARSDAPPRGTRVANEIRAGFLETVIADGLDSPVSMALAPDGRVFVCEQRGTLRIVRGDRLLHRPFVTVPTEAVVEEGLLGVALDPDFPRAPYVYLCWTALTPHRHNRISRFTASGDTALAGSEKIVFDMDDNGAHDHVGGALRFGRDGTLYAGTGENEIGSLSQSLGSTCGKLLRLRPDGSIPPDNPFVANTAGHHRAIWALGFRNVFSFDIHPGTGKILVNDVGGGKAEEVDEAVAGGNYGWPLFEGPGGGAPFRQPLHAYGHDQGCAITGAAFYAPHATRFPREWVGRYLFGEYCRNEIRWLDPDHPERGGVFGVTIAAGPVDLRVAPDGALYYLARGNSGPVGGAGSSRGIVVRVTHSAPAAPGLRATRRGSR